MRSSTRLACSCAFLLAAGTLAACGSDASGDGDTTGTPSGSSSTGAATAGPGGSGGNGGEPTGPGGGGGSGATGGSGECGPDTSAPNEELPDTTDPEAGEFTLEEALAGLPPGPGPLRAIITTDLAGDPGVITCELFPETAPIGVANFIGLARGTRAWKDPVSKKWVKRRFYDGLTFHRVIDDFMAQGGDPLGTGSGHPGYKFANEWGDKIHVPGTLAYANSGPSSNGSQFYITEVATDWLDGGAYTVFGLCTPLSTIEALTAVETGAQDKPLTPVHMTKVEITRCAP